jgi:hypothetical protein
MSLPDYDPDSKISRPIRIALTHSVVTDASALARPAYEWPDILLAPMSEFWQI